MSFENRVAMSDRKSLVSTLWLTSSLVLLASMAVAPTRTTGFVTVSSRPYHLIRNFVLPPSQPTSHITASMATDAARLANALPSENDEEQDWVDALDEPRIAFLIPCSFRKVSDRQSIVPRLILSLYPLRC